MFLRIAERLILTVHRRAIPGQIRKSPTHPAPLRSCGPTTRGIIPEENGGFPKVVASGAALEKLQGAFSSDLQVVIAAWETLPPVVKDEIISLVHLAGKQADREP